MLGLLLVTNDSLVREHLKYLLNLNPTTKIDSDLLNQGLEELGGLVVIDDQRRYSLFHLKFREYLYQGVQRQNKKYLFDTEDEQCWHGRFIAWCGQNNLAQIWDDTTIGTLEEGRRRYARQYYITHIYHSGDWNKLFSVLDEGSYGKAKVKDDLSTHTYARDLDLGRQAASSARWNQKEAILYLPYLWRYTLLRCSLASRADQYPREAFELMLRLGQETKALGLAELLTRSRYKAEIFMCIASHLARQPEREREALQLFLRTGHIISSMAEPWPKVYALSQLAKALAQVQRWQDAERIIGSMAEARHKIRALVYLADALAQHHEYSYLVHVVQREWLRTMRRDEALDLLPLAFGLISRFPELGMAFYDAFAWVDRFLQG